MQICEANITEIKQKDVSRLETKIKQLENDLLQAKLYSRKGNLLVYGIPDHEKNVDDATRKFFVKRLGIAQDRADRMLFVNIHRLPRMNKESLGPVPIIIKFVQMADRDLVLQSAYRNAATLSKEKISVQTDLPPELKFLRHKLRQRALHLRKSRNLLTRIEERGTSIRLKYRRNSADQWSELTLDDPDP